MDKPKEIPNCCYGIDGPCRNRPTWRRQNTAYVDEVKNWVNMCDPCFKYTQEQWADAWSELRQT